MQYGDLSNHAGPAIIIDADLMFTVKKKWFGLRYELQFMRMGSTRKLLESWFYDADLAIYIICTGELKEYALQIADNLHTFMVPHTGIQSMASAAELSDMVEARHVIGYFYNTEKEGLIDARTDKKKFYQVPNIAEISYLLDGGVRR